MIAFQAQDSVTEETVDKILMLKNKPVYNISQDVVLNADLLPGIMQKNPCRETFQKWTGARYYSNSNASARKMFGSAFRQRERADDWSRALALIDCYWIKPSNVDIDFEEISPYFQPFWTGEGDYKKYEAVPTIYTDGFLSKHWIDSEWLLKSGETVHNEVECARLAKLCGINVADVELNHKAEVLVRNFTNCDVMLEQAIIAGGIFATDDWNDDDVIEHFGENGYKMLLIDAIFANGDRHAGNFGYLRDTSTGEYLGMAPLYDWDHALESDNLNDILIRDAVRMLIKYPNWVETAKNIIATVIENSRESKYIMRAQEILKLYNEH